MPELDNAVVIGGGFAGIAAALWIRAQDSRIPVVLLEREATLLPWVERKALGAIPLGSRVGSGEALPEAYPEGWAEIKPALDKWPGSSNLDWLSSIGTALERQGETWCAPSGPALRETLRQSLDNCGVEVRTGFSLETVSVRAEAGFRLWSRDGDALEAGSLLLATGGERNHGMALARDLGHEIGEPVAGFVRFRPASLKMAEKLGPLCRMARVSSSRDGVEATGEVVLSARGLEGAAVGHLSARLGEDWWQRNNQLELQVDWMPAFSSGEALRKLEERIRAGGKKLVGSDPPFEFNDRQWTWFLATARIDPTEAWGRVKRRKLQSLVQQMKAHRIMVAGAGLPAGERAWRGGVSMDQIDRNTGESQQSRGLWFAGEILAFLGLPEGPHLNAVWATAYQAGSELARYRSSSG